MKHTKTISLFSPLSGALSAIITVAGLSFGAATTACSSTPTSDIHVHSAADAKANLGEYKSYAWNASAGMLRDRTGIFVPKDVDTQAEVIYLVDKNMRDRGMTQAREQPDLLVSLLFVADVKDVEEIKSSRGAALTTLDPIGEGALLIELIDAETGKTVWLGGAEGEVRGSRTAEESKERLAYAVDKLFETLPK